MSALITDTGDFFFSLSLRTSGKKFIGFIDIYKEPGLGPLIFSVIVVFLYH